MTIHALPQELLDIVIDNLQSDRKSLRSCTLVTPSWLSRSRYHLFDTVQVGESRYRDFLLFLALHPHVARCVRDLSLNGEITQYQPGLITRTPVTPQLLRALLSTLPNLSKLFLYMPPFSDSSEWMDDPAVKSIIATNVQEKSTFKLKRLRIDYGGSFDRTSSHLLLLLGMFSAIDHLLLKLLRFSVRQQKNKTEVVRAELDRVRGLIPADLRIQSLVINDAWVRSDLYLGIIGETASTETLRSLEMGSQRGWSASAVGALVKQTSRLSNLDLDVSGLREPTHPEQWAREHCLADCRSLTTFTLRMNPTGYNIEPITWPNLHLVLASLPDSVIEVNVYSSFNAMDPATTAFDCDRLDETLARLPGLRKVSLYVPNRSVPENFNEGLQHGLRRTAVRAQVRGIVVTGREMASTGTWFLG